MRIDYLIPGHLDADTVETGLCEQLALSVEPARQEQRVYYDTFDWRLYGNNTVLEGHPDGRQHVLLLRTLDSGKPLARERLDRCPAFIQDLPPG
ncbi:MAG: hypothetical protein KJO66_05405, partial [Gammaproteobacteria bacterium]|nr:hypothetical protein [Gammaproteobacteria bacterium]